MCSDRFKGHALVYRVSSSSSSGGSRLPRPDMLIRSVLPNFEIPFQFQAACSSLPLPLSPRLYNFNDMPVSHATTDVQIPVSRSLLEVTRENLQHYPTGAPQDSSKLQLCRCPVRNPCLAKEQY